MEVLCKDVKENECLDFTNGEISDISRAVDSFITRFIRYISEDGEELQVDRVLQCGSMVEKTKLLRMQSRENVGLEFDYLAIIKRWPGIGEVRYKHTCNGSMEIQYNVTDSESDDGEKDNLSNQAGSMFRLTFVRAIDKRCARNLCVQSACSYGSGERNVSSKGCCACTVYLKSGNLRFMSGIKMHNPHLEFLWTPKYRPQERDDKSVFGPDFDDSTQKKCLFLTNPLIGETTNILVDFHPVFELDLSNIDNADNQINTTAILGKQEKLFLFPKCHKNCKYLQQHLCWRISTFQHELSLIENTSKDHLLAYMVVKFLTVIIYNCMHMIHPSLVDASSYMTKTIFLRHITGCSQSGQCVEQCVMEMLLDLSECFINQSIPHFYLKFNLIMMDPSNQPRFIKSIGKMYRSMAELLMKPNLHKDIADIFKDCISFYLIVWGTELKARQKAWAEVPLTNTGTYAEMLRVVVDSNTMDNIGKNLQEFVTNRDIRSSEDELKRIVMEHVDLQLLGRDKFKMTPFGKKLKLWLKDLYERKKYRINVYTL